MTWMYDYGNIWITRCVQLNNYWCPCGFEVLGNISPANNVWHKLTHDHKNVTLRHMTIGFFMCGEKQYSDQNWVYLPVLLLQGSVHSISAPNSEQWAYVCKHTGGCWLVLMCRCLSADTSFFPSKMIWPMLVEAMVHAALIFISFSTCKVGEDSSQGE